MEEFNTIMRATELLNIKELTKNNCAINTKNPEYGKDQQRTDIEDFFYSYTKKYKNPVTII